METENLFEIFKHEYQSLDESVQNKISPWLKSSVLPPSYTILRVNTLSTDVSDTIQKLQVYLNEQYKIKKCPIPIVSRHSLLEDIIVVKTCGKQSQVIPKRLEVVVGLACGLSVLRGADIYAPGIMGANQSMNESDEVAVFADLEGTCRKGQTKEFCGRKMFLGNGIAQISRANLFKGADLKRGIGVKMIEPIFDCPSLGEFLPDVTLLQNLPSVVCAYVLNPQPNDKVLDMCAAPGGKTTHIATLMKNKGVVIALDKSKPRIKKVQKNAERFGLDIITCYAYDSTKAVSDSTFSKIDGPPPYSEETFDKILLDAPCSGLGQRPLIDEKITHNEVLSFRNLQKKLIRSAVSLLKVNGVLVYSTCSLTLTENEENVAWMLQKFACLSLVTQIPHIGGYGHKSKDIILHDDQLQKLQRFDWIHHFNSAENTCDSDTIGFFIAKFKKNEFHL